MHDVAISPNFSLISPKTLCTLHKNSHNRHKNSPYAHFIQFVNRQTHQTFSHFIKNFCAICILTILQFCDTLASTSKFVHIAILTTYHYSGIIVSQSRERVATETITTPSDEIHSRAERRRKLKRGQNVKRDKRSLWGRDSLAIIKGAAARKPQKGKRKMKNVISISFDDILSELCKGCYAEKHPESTGDPCKWCGATIAADGIYGALKHATPTRHRVPFYSDPRDNVPPAGYVVMEVYGNEVGIIAERQYKRALKNKYVNQTCGIWYAVSFPVFIQRPDGSLYRPHSFEHDN